MQEYLDVLCERLVLSENAHEHTRRALVTHPLYRKDSPMNIIPEGLRHENAARTLSLFRALSRTGR
jgi:hypothetical protein